MPTADHTVFSMIG